MNFKFTEEEQEILEMLDDFCKKEVGPKAAEVDENERFPEETWHALAEMGMMGVPFPEEYGGAGLTYVNYIAVCEKLAEYCATTSVMVSAHSSLCTWPIFYFGTEEQKQKYLPDLCSGEKLGAFGLTEPGAGTDAAMQKTVAEDKGDYYLMNGSKIFITNAGFADTFVVFAMTDKTLGNKGITAFILEKGMEGFSIGAHEKKMGIRGSATTDLIFEDVRVPDANRLGKVGQGWQVVMHTLNGARAGVAAQGLGCAQGALDYASQYVKERKQFGKTLSKFQRTQFEIADMATNIHAGRLMVWCGAWKEDATLRGDKSQADYAMDT
ncbi:MAG: acyl-CoA dehydrogenase family protein, partial [Eubacterium sp.]|nr:acyl-CoA dehydrogenase family protein [Eubacterium sp.]